MLLLTHTFIPKGTQVSRGTDSFIPMHGLLLSLIALNNPMVCEDAMDLINRIRPTVQHRAEIVETIQENTEEGCDFGDAQVD